MRQERNRDPERKGQGEEEQPSPADAAGEIQGGQDEGRTAAQTERTRNPPSPARFVEVAVTLPVRRTFVYEVPEAMHSSVGAGRRVLIPFGRRCLPGFVLGPARTLPAAKKILAIRQVLDEKLSLSKKFLDFLLWTAKYYIQPIGETLKTALPPGMHGRSKEIYALLEKGVQALNTLPPGSAEWSVLSSLQRKGGKGPLPKMKMQEAFLLPALVRRLLAAGWIERKEDSWKPSVHEKKVKFIRPFRKEGEVNLIPRQTEALRFIQSAGEISLQTFREKYKDASALLVKLKKNDLVEIFDKETYRLPSWEDLADWADSPPALLSEAQKKAVEEINQAVQAQTYRPFLLHGVTGSGKTEVYLRVIEETIAQGRQALLLVPEISLTSQLIAYFKSRLGHPFAVLHSGISPGARFDEWRRIKKGLVQLVIGARSAIFAPLDHVGIIVVDEEHDPSYKQEDKVRYHARDLALVRGKMEQAVVVLGSATPSMETYYNVLGKKFHYLSLPARIDQRPLPQMEIADMRPEKGAGKEPPIFSRALEQALQENAQRGEQALLFLNRRGFSTFALCWDCGFVYKCPNCSISLVYHLADRSYRCHYCGYTLPALSRCPACGSIRLKLFGLGTQRLEAEVKRNLPGIRVGRMDRDTTARKTSHQRILNQVRRGEINFLIGTQMITKGHDFPRVTLVGVLAADLSLNVPDFRAAERTFQLLTQVAGRAGRGTLPGKVIIQTYNPHHYSIRLAQAQHFHAFYEEEVKFRQAAAFPPFVRLINLRLEGNSEEVIVKTAQSIVGIFRKLQRAKEFGPDLEMLGPAKCPLARLKGKCRWQILLKGKRWGPLHALAERVLQRVEEEVSLTGVRLIIDVDPINML